MTKKRSTDIRTCPVCGHTVQRSDMQFTRDCNGIPFRLVCWDCYDQLMAKGYDGEYYRDSDTGRNGKTERSDQAACGSGAGSGSRHRRSSERNVQRGVKPKRGASPVRSRWQRDR